MSSNVFLFTGRQGHHYSSDSEYNQELESLKEQADQIVRFMQLSPNQQRTFLLCGRGEAVLTIRKMIKTLSRLAYEFPQEFNRHDP